MKTVLFDFDGTIANSVPTILELINKVLKSYGYRPIDHAEMKEMRNKNLISILRNSKINIFFMPFMYLHGKLLFRKELKNIKPFEGIDNALKMIKENYKIGVVTSNSKESVRVFFEDNNLPEPNFIYASNSPFGKDRLINKCLKQNGISKNDVVYVGDEIRDIKACNKVGIPIISASWGFNTRKSLEEKKPDLIIDEVSHIYKSIEKLLN